MQIDWFTLAAQVVNFLILMALLRLVFYDRVLKIMRRREDEVSERLRSAEAKHEEAQEHAAALQEEREQLEAKRRERLAEIQEEISERREEMLRDIRNEVERTRDNWRESISRERESIVHDIQEHLSNLVAAAVEQALSDLADERLDDRIIDVFLCRLSESDEAGWRDLRETLRTSGHRVVITTARHLPDEREQEIANRITETVGTDAPPQFEQDVALIAGLEVAVAGQHFGWNLDDYITRLRADFTEAVESELGLGAKDGR